jgi:Domain of unknown function (DUF4167)
MRPNHQNKRMRGRNRNGKGPNPLSRTYESNGPDVKVRGTAQHIAEKYMQLGRDASATGDHIAAENYFQHAEHYLRLIAAAQEQYRLQNPHYQPYSPHDQDDEGGDDEMAFGHGAPQPDMRFSTGPQPDMDQEDQPRMPYQPREPREPREFREPREPRDYQSRGGQGEGQPRDQREPREPREGREPREPREGRYQRDDRFPRRERGEFRNRGERGERNEQPRYERQPAEAADDNVLPAFITAPVRPLPVAAAIEEPEMIATETAPEAGEFPRRRRGRPPRRPAEAEGE